MIVPIVLVALAVASLTFVAQVSVSAWQRRRERRPPADWWPRFEQEFRAYAERATRERIARERVDETGEAQWRRE